MPGFRWGAPELDTHFVSIPVVVLMYATQAGVDAQELVFLLHLASMREVSLGEVADRMGLSLSAVKAIAKALEEKGLLQVLVEKKGDGTLGDAVYDATPFAQKVLALAAAEKSQEPTLVPQPQKAKKAPKPTITVDKEYRQAIFDAWQRIHLLPDGTDPLTKQDYAVLQKVVEAAYKQGIPLEDVLGTIEAIGQLAEKDPAWKMAKPPVILKHISSFRMGVLAPVQNGKNNNHKEVLHAYEATLDFRRAGSRN